MMACSDLLSTNTGKKRHVSTVRQYTGTVCLSAYLYCDRYLHAIPRPPLYEFDNQ